MRKYCIKLYAANIKKAGCLATCFFYVLILPFKFYKWLFPC